MGEIYLQAAAAQVQNAVAGYGKLFSSYPALSAYRYAPYPIPAATMAAAQQAPPQAPQAQAQAQTAATAPGNPYQGYSLTNVDMSSFQGVDWGSMYGMGMYV